jgi:hypothetical protein
MEFTALPRVSSLSSICRLIGSKAKAIVLYMFMFTLYISTLKKLSHLKVFAEFGNISYVQVRIFKTNNTTMKLLSKRKSEILCLKMNLLL